MKNLAQDIMNGAFAALEQSIGTSVSEASIRNIIADETEIALLQRKTYQAFASDLAARLHSQHFERWRMVARTELHRAKVAGNAQAIVNKIGIYSNGDGPDSRVSVIPASAACGDCRDHYVGPDGNPIIFLLRDLMSAGSNGDAGVVHTKKQGLHVHWKTTLPPLHPNCGCNLVFIPQGYDWDNGKLTLKKGLEKYTLFKAQPGVSSTDMKATVKPRGPNGAKNEPGPPSITGAPAPGNMAGPGRPPASGATPKVASPGGGSAQQTMPCPFGGGANCIANGGNGAMTHEANSTVMKKHQEAMMRGARATTEAGKEQQHAMHDQAAKQYNSQAHPHAKTIEHLSEGQIGSLKRVESDSFNAPFKVTIVGNGSGAMKKPVDVNDMLADIQKRSPSSKLGGLVGDSIASVPHGTDHHREVGMYKMSQGLGLSDHVPPTVYRHHDGSDGGPRGITSVQQWKDGYKTVGAKVGNDSNNEIRDILKHADFSNSREKVATKLAEIGVLDIITNNNDRHHNNLMVNDDVTDVVGIDHGGAFGNGMQGHKNIVAQGFNQMGKKFGVPGHLKQRLDNMSFGDFKRSSQGSHLEDWAVAQSFLRARYVSHLQEKHGHIPYDRVQGVIGSVDGSLVLPRDGFYDGDFSDFMEKSEKKQLPEHHFDNFAKTYLTKAASDPTHKDHEDAKAMMALGPLMGRGMATDVKKYRDEGNHQKHWDSVPGDYDLDFEDPGKADAQSSVDKMYGSSAPVRTAPEMPKPKQDVDVYGKTSKPTPASDMGKTKKPGAAAQESQPKLELDAEEFEEKFPEAKAKKESSTIELGDDDIPSVDIEDDDVDAAFDRIKAKKSLYIADFRRAFPA
jgi:hypothetical protein